MLSILIPCYNYDVRPLVHCLHRQLLQLSVPAEIRCVEDASDPAFAQLNQTVQGLSHVHWEALPQNIGRAKIRNYLAQQAQYPYLLFMDCDGLPDHDNYLSCYVHHLMPHTVLYGGRSYAPTPPTAPHHHFHWYYGSQREVQPVEQRQQRPYHAFMTNNFLVPKAIFLPIQFDESLRQYGHEDTLFGLALKQQDVPILHLDNPLRHIGLDDQSQFLKKSQLALQNLHRLYERGQLSAQSTKLLSWYHRLQFFAGFLALLGYGLRPLLWAYLNRQKQPPLVLFDVYKLLYFIYWTRQHRL